MAARLPEEGPERDWFVVARWQEYEGERRANLLRCAVLAAFYCVELVDRYGLRLGPLAVAAVPDVTAEFHKAVTALTAAWILTGWGVLALLREQVFPGGLKYLSTALDLVLLSTVLMVADGPRSPLLPGYLLLVLLAGLRMSLPLVRATTAGAMAAYLVLVVQTAQFRTPLMVPRHHAALFLLALAAAGVMTGQVVRRARAAAEDYAARRAKPGTA